MRRFRDILPVLLILAFALGLAAQPAQIGAMDAGMTMAAHMDGAEMDDCPDCDGMGRNEMASSSCQGGACVAMPTALAEVPALSWQPTAGPGVRGSDIGAGLTAEPDPYPPRSRGRA